MRRFKMVYERHSIARGDVRTLTAEGCTFSDGTFAFNTIGSTRRGFEYAVDQEDIMNTIADEYGPVVSFEWIDGKDATP